MHSSETSLGSSTITIVVPVKNEATYIDRCLRSIINQDYPFDRVTVIVVDNGSTDGTLDVVRRYEDRVIVLEKQEGSIASLRNYGARQRESDLIAFLDGDCVVPVDWLTKGHDILNKSEEIAGVGFAAAKPDQQVSWVARIWHEMSSTSKYSGTQPVLWLSSFNLILRKKNFDFVGGFDEDLITCEDYDLGLRLSKFYSLIFSDTISVCHLGVVNGVLPFFQKEFWRGKNNLATLVKGNFSISSLLGVAVPLWQIVCLLFLIVNLFFGLFSRIFVVFLLFLAPLLLTLRKINKKTLNRLFPIFFLYNIYLLARGLAVICSLWKKLF